MFTDNFHSVEHSHIDTAACPHRIPCTVGGLSPLSATDGSLSVSPALKSVVVIDGPVEHEIIRAASSSNSLFIISF